jgi:cobalt-zinc-cadmium efflux system outer membrane protein
MAKQGIGSLCLLLVGLAGCASVNLNAGFSEVGAVIEERAGTKIVWNRGADLDNEAADTVQALLGTRFTADDAVQIAMLNNRDLQAIYSDLGLAQADLVQAGLFRNPIFDAAVLFPLSGIRPELQLTVVISFLDALYVPLRKRVAAARFEEAKLRVSGAVLDLAAEVRRAFYEHQANEQMLELRQAIVQALVASWEVSRRLHEAGNTTDLDLARDRAAAETSKLALRSAEIAVRQSRERLNDLMGTWGEQTSWEIDGRLPEVPAEPPPTNGLERVALSRSMDLSQARQRIITAGKQLGYDRATAFVPEAEVGAEAERESEGNWRVGPVFSVPIPLFDQGQARVGRAIAELRRTQQAYYAMGVRIRATARAVRDRMLGARDRALYYRDILLPLQERIVNEAQLQYNAMQIGIFHLLRDRERQIETGVAYVETLREYWLARTDLLQLSSGRLPGSNGIRRRGDAGEATMTEGGNGH